MLHINVSEHTEKKNGLTYLSWAWAWAQALKEDAGATWGVVTYGEGKETQPFLSVGQTAMVHTWVTIKGLRRDCMLPVMDHRNKAIPNPDAFAVNTALMRCMTKALSMHGLGLNIYAGEDLPLAEDPAHAAEAERLANRGHELDTLAGDMIGAYETGQELQAIRMWYDAGTWSKDVPEANEERKYVWGLLHEYSKLRSAIKANAPEKLAA